ncbi:MAG: DNA-3-methyladenine glycosylase [Bryobacter sp.]|nr:DNA-3-methyladenine glycosylase [Bryobacter sp.]
MSKFDRNFFSRPASEVARDLLGKRLVHQSVADVIVEVEAYLPEGDAAAHVYRGPTPRTRILYGQAGHAYLYLNYGLHWMLNIAADREGVPGCVLLRGTRRFRGPGLLTKGFGLDGRHYGLDLTSGPLWVEEGESEEEEEGEEVLVTPRIGITKAAELPLRFVWASYESKRRPGKSRLSAG